MKGMVESAETSYCSFMKVSSFVVAGLVVAVAGAVLITTHNIVRSTGVVITCSVLFIIAGLMNVLVYETGRRRGDSVKRSGLATVFSRVSSAACVILGVSMLIFSETFTTLIPYLFGALVALAGFYQVYVLVRMSKSKILSPWFYVVPVGLLISAVYLCVQVPDDYGDPVVMLTTGVAAFVFGVIMIVEGVLVSRNNRNVKQIEDGAGEELQNVNIETTDQLNPKPLDVSER